jgi:hypothetical protein
MRQAAIIAIGALLAASVQAQEEEIVVTGLRANNYDEMPAVTIRKAADFLVQEVQLVNDSRAPDLRRSEIIATITGMLKRAASDQRMALSYGDGFLEPVNLSDDSLQILEDKKHVDTSSVNLFVKITLQSNDNTKDRIADLRKFIHQTQPVGRTEIEVQGDVGLSVVNPERYRHEIMEQIAAENARISGAMQSKCHLKLGGLERRVHWERTDIAQLTLFIPYTAEVTDCAYGPS